MGRTALADLFLGALGGGFLHLLTQSVQVVCGGDDGEQQEQQTGERDRKLKDWFRATPLAKPKVGSRAKQEEPTQVKN